MDKYVISPPPSYTTYILHHILHIYYIIYYIYITSYTSYDNQDVVGDKCVKDDSGNLSFDNEAKKVAWKQHYERLLNEEFSWNPEDLTADPVVGPPIHIDVEMVVKAITKMKTGKAAGPRE